MSLYSALFAGVSGLGAQSNAMAVISDNITNINTVAYKGMEAQFRTMVTDGRNSGSYSAGGVAASAVSQVSKQGLLLGTGSSTDLAIEGAGFFITRRGLRQNDDVAYTRAGSFKPDEEGYMRNAAGLYLYGWRLDAQGKYTNTGGLEALEPIRVNDLVGTASATTKIQVRANLQSDAATYTGVYNDGDMAKGTVKPTFNRTFTISDAQGGKHQLNMSFLKTGPNSWQVETYVTPAGDVTAANGLLVSGTMKFNGDGSLDKAGSTPALFKPLNVTYTNGAGSVPIEMQLGEDKGITGITSYGQPSSLISSNVDGGLLGNIAGIEVSKTGVLSVVFSDGSTRKVFQLPLATFPNPDGLTRASGNAYTANRLSGGMTMNAPGELGAGNIAGSSLEASTVDLAGEFTNMIRFQRAYSAASKIITTVDDMLREVSDLKR